MYFLERHGPAPIFLIASWARLEHKAYRVLNSSVSHSNERFHFHFNLSKERQTTLSTSRVHRFHLMCGLKKRRRIPNESSTFIVSLTPISAPRSWVGHTNVDMLWSSIPTELSGNGDFRLPAVVGWGCLATDFFVAGKKACTTAHPSLHRRTLPIPHSLWPVYSPHRKGETCLSVASHAMCVRMLLRTNIK